MDVKLATPDAQLGAMPEVPFTGLTMFTATLEAQLRGLSVEVVDFIRRAKIPGGGSVLAINSNFGHIAAPGFERYLKAKRKVRAPTGKNPKPAARPRKFQGDGTCFNSALEPIIKLNPAEPGTKVYMVKCFPTTGQTQVPGTVRPDFEDGIAVIEKWVEFLNIINAGSMARTPAAKVLVAAPAATKAPTAAAVKVPAAAVKVPTAAAKAPTTIKVPTAAAAAFKVPIVAKVPTAAAAAFKVPTTIKVPIAAAAAFKVPIAAKVPNAAVKAPTAAVKAPTAAKALIVVKAPTAAVKAPVKAPLPINRELAVGAQRAAEALDGHLSPPLVGIVLQYFGWASAAIVTLKWVRQNMVNFKFQLSCAGPRVILNLERLGAYLIACEANARPSPPSAPRPLAALPPGCTQVASPYKIREVKPPKEGVRLTFCVVVSEERNARVKIFQRGKVNILGSDSFATGHTIHAFVTALFRANWSQFVCVQPLPDPDEVEAADEAAADEAAADEAAADEAADGEAVEDEAAAADEADDAVDEAVRNG